MKLSIVRGPATSSDHERIAVDNRGGLVALLDKSGMIIFSDQPVTLEEAKQIVTVAENYELFKENLKN